MLVKLSPKVRLSQKSKWICVDLKRDFRVDLLDFDFNKYTRT